VSVNDVLSRIQQLQGQFALLSAGSPRTAAPGGTAFAATLDGVAGADAAWDPTAEGAGVPGGAAEQAVIEEARKYLGVPYVWGGTDPQRGLDCSGLVQLVYRKFGVDLPRVSYQQARAGTPVASLAEARPGDILAFGSPVHHVGIYIGDNLMIEAPRPGLEVRVAEVTETPSAIRRVLPTESTTGPGPARTNLAGGTPYADLFQAAEARYRVPATLLAAIAHQESGFNPGAVSHAGARGLMQLMPATARGLGVRDPHNPAQAVDGAARLMRDLIAQFGRVDHALAAYNAGPGAVLRYDGIPPYPETQRYVPAVLCYQRRLETAA
jgi:peptidoglycan DL-endopeptidase CwlO